MTTRSVRRFEPQLLRAQGIEQGWSEVEGSVLAHPGLGIYLVRVMTLEGERVLYDHVLRAERNGGFFLPVDAAGRVGLLPVWRPQARDPERYAESFPELDLSALGRVSYEAPRGFALAGERGVSAAVREAEEETERRVLEVQPLGSICDNTAFSPHLVTAAWGRLGGPAGGAGPEPAEGILARLSFFTRAELASLQREGLLYDGFTLSALALLWIQHPELLEGGGG